jgi:dTDP-4-amino-4,6-dideoxygalactose transaminase
MPMKVTMAWSNLTPNAKKYVKNVLDRGWLSYSLYMPRFERLVAEMHGAKHGILVNSGTDALRISLATLKELHKWPENAEVIVPAVTFVATANAVLQNGLKPVFSEVDLVTGNLDWAKASISKSTVAVLPVHLFGLPGPIPKTKLRVVEDSCETFGTHKLTGEMACFSFYMSHHVSTGVGGMILTNSELYAKIARSFQNHGRIDDGSHFQFGRSGYSSRITEMEAALGIAALEHFRKDLIKRRQLADAYIEQLSGLDQLQMPPVDYTHSWMFFPVRLTAGHRDKLLNTLRINEIESREAMPLINQPVFKDLYKKGSCPNAENWTKNGILLPLHPKMTEKDVEFVCKVVRRFFN